MSIIYILGHSSRTWVRNVVQIQVLMVYIIIFNFGLFSFSHLHRREGDPGLRMKVTCDDDPAPDRLKRGGMGTPDMFLVREL